MRRQTFFSRSCCGDSRSRVREVPFCVLESSTYSRKDLLPSTYFTTVQYYLSNDNEQRIPQFEMIWVREGLL